MRRHFEAELYLTTSLTDAAFQATMISGGQSDLNI